MCIFHVVNFKGRPQGSKTSLAQGCSNTNRFTKEMKRVLNRMMQFTLVLSSDFPYITLANSFIVGACAVRTCLVDGLNKIYFCDYNYLRSRNRSFKAKIFVKYHLETLC